MSRLFLHIGSHKTGTTSIQRACRSALKRSEPDAVHYLNIRPSGTRILHSEGVGETFRAEIDLDTADRLFRPEPVRRGFAKPAAARSVSSDEEFFWISDPDPIRNLAALLRPRYETITVICYLRRQDLLALSHRKQVAEGSPATRFYGITATPLPEFRPHYHRYFDYAAKLALWADAFGQQNIQVIPYEPDALRNGDVVEDFAARTGIRFAPGSGRRENASLEGSRTFVGLKLAEIGVPPRRRKIILDSLPGTGKFLPSQAEARDFLARFAEANAQLARDWTWQGAPFRFDTSFEMYPETAGPEWSHAEVNGMFDAVMAGRSGGRGKDA